MKNFSIWHHRNKDLGILVLRLAIGIVFLMHGIEKLADIHGTTAFFAHLGLGAFSAWTIAIIETISGIGLILGFWTQIAALLIATEMLVIILWLNWAGSFEHYNLEFIILAATIAIACTGSGKYAISKRFGGVE